MRHGNLCAARRVHVPKRRWLPVTATIYQNQWGVTITRDAITLPRKAIALSDVGAVAVQSTGYNRAGWASLALLASIAMGLLFGGVWYVLAGALTVVSFRAWRTAGRHTVIATVAGAHEAVFHTPVLRDAQEVADAIMQAKTSRS